jgi:hypothetical protein
VESLGLLHGLALLRLPQLVGPDSAFSALPFYADAAGSSLHQRGEPAPQVGAYRSRHVRGGGQFIRLQCEEQRDWDGAIFANVFPEDAQEQVASR